MSRKRRPAVPPAEAPPLRPGATRAHPAPWKIFAAIGWLALFLVLFSSFDLPNNPQVSRVDIWTQLPFLLLEVVDPLPIEGQVPPPSGWQYLPQRFDLIAIAAVILAGAWGLGHLVFRLIAPPLAPRSLERTVFAFALGLSGWSLITLGFGLAGSLSQWLFGAMIAATIAGELFLRLKRADSPSGPLSLWERVRVRGNTKTHSSQDQHRMELPEGQGARERAPVELIAVCLVAMSPFLLAMALGSMLPSTDFDVKEYHLQGPKEYWQNGRIAFLPHNVYTSFPFLTEMLSLLAMTLRGDWFRGALAGQLVLMTFAPLTALALYAAGRRWFSPAAGWLAATIHLTTPWIYRISTIAYTEGGLAFYLFATLLAVLLGIEALRARISPRMLFLLSGLLAGSAMACKYPGVLSVVIPLGAVIVALPFAGQWLTGDLSNHNVAQPPPERAGGSQSLDPSHPDSIVEAASRSPWKIALRWGVIFTAGVLITIGPWLLKNLVETGNPVYPLLYSVFGGRDWDAELNAKWKAGHSPDNHDPVDLAVKFIDVTLKSDWLSPLLFGLAPLAFYVGRHRRLIIGLWLFVAYLFLQWWIFTHRIDRFWVPMIPVVSLLAGVGATWSESRAWRYIAGQLIALAILFNLAVVTSGLSGYNAYLIDLNYSRQWTANLTAPEIALLNRMDLPADAKVLLVGDAEVFDAEFPLVYNTVFDRSIFEDWFGMPQPGTPKDQWPLRNASAIRTTLREHGITYVYVSWAEILRYRLTYGYTDFVTPKRFEVLQQIGILTAPIHESAGDWENLSSQQREELERWGPELIRTRGNERVWISGQIFEVR